MFALLFSVNGFIAQHGWPARYVERAKFAERFPLNEATARLARAEGLTIFVTTELAEPNFAPFARQAA